MKKKKHIELYANYGGDGRVNAGVMCYECVYVHGRRPWYEANKQRLMEGESERVRAKLGTEGGELSKAGTVVVQV